MVEKKLMPLDQTTDGDPKPSDSSEATAAPELEPDSAPDPELASNPDSESQDDQPTDKLDRLAGGRTVSEHAPTIPRGPRGARAAVLQALYEEDLTGHPALRALDRLPAYQRLSPAQTDKAEALIGYISEHRAELDARIATVAKEFPVSQLGTVDRNVLRIALAELEPGQNTPKAVAVNEAVELAKLFGSDSSPKFVNGVLGALLR